MAKDATRCPRCRKSELVYRTLQRTGDVYAVCADYPKCSYVGDFVTVKPERKQAEVG
jgi:ssDNA-binding Zn-finger/Zn-ribbon topoisomerase 1